MLPPGAAAGGAGGGRERLLRVLSEVRPSWTDRDRAAAEAKLARLGVCSAEALAEALRGPLNQRLRAAGLQTFTAETVRALRGALGVELAEEAAAAEAPTPSVPSRAPAASTPAATAAPSPGRQADVLSGPMGVWLGGAGDLAYEVRSVADGGFRACCDRHGRGPDPDAAGEEGCREAPAEPDGGSTACTGLWYAERAAGGGVLCGALRHASPETGWAWDADLADGSQVRLRPDGPRMLSAYRLAGSALWSEPNCATRPQLYAFYNANDHPQGFRHVHLGHAPGVGAAGSFPIVGLTAGWLPAVLVSPGDEERARKGLGQVRVRCLGTFCDPFDVAPSPAVATRIQVAAPDAARASPTAQVLMLGGGAVLVQPASTASIYWAKKPGRPPPKGLGKGLGKPWSFSKGFPALARARFSNPQPDPLQTVASAFRCTKNTLRDHAVFRGKLRKLPESQVQRDLEISVPAALLRYSDGGAPVAPSQPLVSIVCVRWFDYWSDPDRSSDYSTLNDGYFVDLFGGPCSVGELLPGEYEVLTIFIRGTADLAKLHPDRIRAMLRGRNVVAWYFVWPAVEGEGFVREPAFFDLLRDMERCPIRTGWPHESTLYRELCGKLWVPQMCLNRDFRVPPTTRVHFADFRRDAKLAASRALDALQRLSADLWSKEPADLAVLKGVVKLGFSWCGSDVLPFKGLESLVANLGTLFRSRASESTVCLVQEMVPGVVGEHRVICMYDKARRTFRKEAVWIENMKPGVAQHKHGLQTLDVADFKVASSQAVPPAAVASRLFGGDAAAMRAAEAQALELVDKWLEWFKTQAPEPPQCTRIDFLATHPAAGRAVVWTCEVGECGASLCTVEVHGRNLAALNNAILHDPSGRFPMPLPAVIPRNNGFKS